MTDCQNVQLHWVQVEDVPEIWRRLAEVGLDTTEACGDVGRVGRSLCLSASPANWVGIKNKNVVTRDT